jgi:hypothetical protein
MSLFSTREWWSARLGEREEFDQASLCVASLADGTGATACRASLLGCRAFGA